MKFAANKTELAREVDLTRSGLQNFFQMPGHPETRSDGRHDVEAWRSFVQAHRFTQSSGRNGNGVKYEPSEREKAITAKNLADAERARFKLKVETGEYLLRERVCLDVETAHSVVRRELSKRLLHECPPRVEGLSAIEIKRVLRKVVDELSDALCGQLKDFALGVAGGSSGV
jgi:hypothetical protein